MLTLHIQIYQHYAWSMIARNSIVKRSEKFSKHNVYFTHLTITMFTPSFNFVVSQKSQSKFRQIQTPSNLMID